MTAFTFPPTADAIGCKRGRVMSRTDENRTLIRRYVVDAVGNGFPIGHRRKVMVIDKNGAGAPRTATISEVADELLLLGVYADDRIATTFETSARSGDMFELLVTQCAGGRGSFARCSDLFVVNSQRVSQITQKRRYRVGTHRDIQFAQLHRDALRRLARPYHPTHGISRRFVHHQLMDALNDFRRFF